MEDLEDEGDLHILVRHYLEGLSLTGSQIDGIVKFYLYLRRKAVNHLTDGTGQKPHFRYFFQLLVIFL